MRTTIDQVREFQSVFDGVNMPGYPERPAERTIVLRLHLITEELSELEHAICKGDLVKVLDGLCDLQYVIDGTTLACGLETVVTDPKLIFKSDPQYTTPFMTPKPVRVLMPFHWGLVKLTEGFDSAHHGAGLAAIGMGLTLLNQAVQLAVNAFGMGGIWDDAFAEVHRSNMSKRGPDGRPVTDGAGRVVKGPGFSPANLEQFIVRKAQNTEPEEGLTHSHNEKACADAG